jgi:hypothetical protein
MQQTQLRTMAYNQYNPHNPYKSYLCGCYFYGTHVLNPFQPQPRIKQYLPLLESEAHSTILSTASKTVLKQTFVNPFSEEGIKECIYTFPLYDGVSVVGFTCFIGSRTLTGVVKEKMKAKEIFDEAVAKGETAGLLEQASEASDVFSTKLGNIPAGESVIVEITYIGELKHHETEGIRFTIPTRIAPRYGQGPSHAITGGSQAKQEGGIKITVDINMPEGSFIKGVQSPSHPIAVSMGALSTASDADPTMNKASATLSLGSAALEKDFVLIVQSKDVGIPKAILETHPSIPHHRALMATLVPKFSLPPSRPEIVFVADRSGSMRANISMLISAMKVFLKSMPVGVKFNICSFGSHATFLFPQSKSYTSETLQEAVSHTEGFHSNMGGTETFNAIKSTIERRYTDLPLEIILLTDGDIWHQEELFAYLNEQVKETDGKIRLFPLGIGNGVSSALIEGLARAGNGFSQSVQEGERLDNSVVRMLRGALTPHITDYTLEVKYEKDDDDFELIDRVTESLKVLLSNADNTQPKPQEPRPTISLFDANAEPEKDDMKIQVVDYLPNVPHPKLLQAPHKIPSLFAFSRTTVYLLMSPETVQRNPTAVVLRATSTHGPLALEIPIEVLSTPAQTIHQLAAKKAVQDLEEGRGWIFDAKDQAGVFVKDRYPSRFEDLVRREAVRLGEQFQVAGKWCSFVAVAANDAEIKAKLAKRGEDVELDDNLKMDFSVDCDSSENGEVVSHSRSSIDFKTLLPSHQRKEGVPANRSRQKRPHIHPPRLSAVANSTLSQAPGPRSFTPTSAPLSPAFSPSSPPLTTGNGQQLQDYQMQLMLLEQQNKKRNMMARSQQPSEGSGPPAQAYLAQACSVSTTKLAPPPFPICRWTDSICSTTVVPVFEDITDYEITQVSLTAQPFGARSQQQQQQQQAQTSFGSAVESHSSGGAFGTLSSQVSTPDRFQALKSNDEEAYLNLTRQSQHRHIGRGSTNLFRGGASERCGSRGSFQGEIDTPFTPDHGTRSFRRSRNTGRYESMRQSLLTADARYVSRSEAEYMSGLSAGPASHHRSAMPTELAAANRTLGSKQKMSGRAVPISLTAGPSVQHLSPTYPELYTNREFQSAPTAPVN